MQPLKKTKFIRRKPRVKPAEATPPTPAMSDYHQYCLTQMPKGAIKADLTKHAPHNSYSPPFWYADMPKTCVECGKEFVFTARQQLHWFEFLKIPIHVTANRCPACRQERRRAIAAQKHHMEEVAKKPPHPNEAFFRKKSH